jgi:hypothetical protein
MEQEQEQRPRSDVPVPKRMEHLAVNRAGYIVPAFVAVIDGEPDFRIADSDHLYESVTKRRCWVCGEKITGPTSAFVIGPMCAVNHVSSEPPSHVECARYSVQACPFLVNPKKRRREGKLPDAELSTAGEMIRRNPGVTLIWVSRHWNAFRVANGILFDIGPAIRTEWWAEGRPATREEVLYSIETGLPQLAEMAEKDGPDAVAALAVQVEQAMELVPV